MLYSGLWFWLRWICFALFYLLDGIHQLIPVWGLAIMVLSVVVHVAMVPIGASDGNPEAGTQGAHQGPW